MARPKKLKQTEVTDALQKSHGLITGAAEILGVAYNTIARYVAESEDARGVIEHFRIRRTDRAEYKLDEAIERGEAWAVALALKDNRFGRERGYGNALDVSGNMVTKVIFIDDTGDNQTPETPPDASGGK